jgi:hypothetical protein
MLEVPHWHLPKTIRIAQSAGGVPVTIHPDDNLVHNFVTPWPPPELLRKMIASGKFRGATPEDDIAARSGLGYYCDLQSLNSEDALTWSVFGSLAYLPQAEKVVVTKKLFSQLGIEHDPGDISIWLWHRIPHPENSESSRGPEIDFGILDENNLILGEAKWNSSIGTGQGVNKNRSQLDFRLMFCNDFARCAFPNVRNFMVVGLARTQDLFDIDQQSNNQVSIINLTWETVIDCFEGALREELQQYLAWRLRVLSGFTKHSG